VKPDVSDIFGLGVGLFFFIGAVPLIIRRKRVLEGILRRQSYLYGRSFGDRMASRTDHSGNVLIAVGVGWFVLGGAISYYSLLGLGVRL
jgi:hypothetical protein